jgi:anti-anti-sigma regulatory factor/anti-sigma regulatory factor (Ser/Thr protein kinase)
VDPRALVVTPLGGYPDTTLGVRGSLTFATAPIIRRAVNKCVTDQPDAVLVDLTKLSVQDDIALTVFPALQRAANESDVAIALVGPSPEVYGQLDAMAVMRTVPVYPSRELALAARPPLHRTSRLVLPSPLAGAQVREVVHQFCARLGLAQLADLAGLVATELAANAVKHARTEFTLTLTVRPRHLHIAVHDHDSRLPVIRTPDAEEGGLGLLVVSGICAGWGVARQPDGKVVWALLSLPRVR